MVRAGALSMAAPTTPITRAAFRYRPAAKTSVAQTLEAERKRIGALTGAQVREQRRRAEQSARATPPHHPSGSEPALRALPTPIARKA